MNRPESRAIARDLIVRSDILINNFRVGQMNKWGLGWDDVHAINPRLIYVEMNLQGSTGPHSHYMGFGVNLNALCGLTHQSGLPGKKPFGTGTHYTDHVMAPAHALFAILVALMIREVTGIGQTIEISQLEAALCMKPSDVMVWTSNGEVAGPLGVSDPHAAPHGVYATDDNWQDKGNAVVEEASYHPTWIAIAVSSDEQWSALKRVMGHPSWAEDSKFATLTGRKEHEDELNAHVEAWLQRMHLQSRGVPLGIGHEPPDRLSNGAARLAKRLMHEGVSAGPVNDARGVVHDEHLEARGFWHILDHPEMGPTRYHRGPIVFSETPLQMRSAAPLLGEHTREVLTGILGYTDDEVDELIKSGVLT